MWKASLIVASALLLSACASNADRLMDAQVRPGEHADCLVGGERTDVERAGGARSMRDRRCNPEGELSWGSDSRKGSMDVDFKKKHD